MGQKKLVWKKKGKQKWFPPGWIPDVPARWQQFFKDLVKKRKHKQLLSFRDPLRASISGQKSGHLFKVYSRGCNAFKQAVAAGENEEIAEEIADAMLKGGFCLEN